LSGLTRGLGLLGLADGALAFGFGVTGLVPLGVCKSVLLRPPLVEGGPLGFGFGFWLSFQRFLAASAAFGDEYPLSMNFFKTPRIVGDSFFLVTLFAIMFSRFM